MVRKLEINNNIASWLQSDEIYKTSQTKPKDFSQYIFPAALTLPNKANKKHNDDEDDDDLFYF